MECEATRQADNVIWTKSFGSFSIKCRDEQTCQNTELNSEDFEKEKAEL